MILYRSLFHIRKWLMMARCCFLCCVCAEGLVFFILSGRHCECIQWSQLEAISTVPATLNSLHMYTECGRVFGLLSDAACKRRCVMCIYHINQASFALLRAPVDRLNICKRSHRRGGAGINGRARGCL